MKSGTAFFLAARQCEIAELEQLQATSELVGVLGRFTHALQRERGLSNVFLASGGERYGPQRARQVQECQLLEAGVRQHVEQLDTGVGATRNGARLFSRIAVLLHALEGLPELRARIGRQQLPAREATTSFIQLVACVLAVVFEAVDSATDPEISRALVAMFNFMQGKEFAGQERAFGAAVFALGTADAPTQQQWRHLVELQQGCFQVFHDFSAPEVLAADHASQDPRTLAHIERLRRIGTGAGAQALDRELSLSWYECCTRRIDAMKTVEDRMALHLRGLCDRRITQAHAELRDQQALVESLAQQARASSNSAPAPLGRQLEKSVLDMVQQQARRLQSMSEELDTARASLTERKVIERAKGLLMAHRQMSEDEAYKALREMAMNQNRRLHDVAQAVLSMADVLPLAR